MVRLRSLMAASFIGVYLCALSWGIMAHALKVGLCGNTLTYYVVWDMFCGWTAWDSRTHLVAEGESGTFYDVEEPWGAFTPFGSVGRIHYDFSTHLLSRHLGHMVRHTRHEPIARIHVVEEVWPKQYNLPPKLYADHFGRPNDKLSYYHKRAICNDDGSIEQMFPDWHAQQTLQAVFDNPRMRRQASSTTSKFSTLYNPSASLSGNSLNTAMGLSTN